MPPLIQPRTLKGFRDYPPSVQLPRERLIDTAKRVYRSFGFCPIDTPALEYSEILLGKGGDETDKQMYRFTDHGGRDVALRFDLTIPFARFSAQHIGQLGTPFRRYHIGPVWRGENTQRGRYREFLQCDFDTIGTESVMSDIESALVIHELLAAVGFDRFRVQINNRRVLTGVLERVELADQSVPILRALDKLAKIGPDKVAAEMSEQAGASPSQTTELLKLAAIEGSSESMIEQLAGLVAGSATGESGRDRLAEVVAALRQAGVTEERVGIDLSIARGLDYYTGTVFETVLLDLPGIGSVCSGGRYDDLASLYTNQRLSGIGASFGLDRMLAAMEELGLIDGRSAAADVFIAFFAADHGPDYLALAARLRAAGLGVEVYPDAKKLGAQLKYADKRGYDLAIIVGDSEWAARTAQLKDLRSGASQEVTFDELAAACHARLKA